MYLFHKIQQIYVDAKGVYTGVLRAISANDTISIRAKIKKLINNKEKDYKIILFFIALEQALKNIKVRTK